MAGGGACEIELSKQLTTFGETCPGMDQYAIKKFAEALTHIPRILAENSGSKGREHIATLLAAHEAGEKNAAVDIENDKPSTVDAEKVTLDPIISD